MLICKQSIYVNQYLGPLGIWSGVLNMMNYVNNKLLNHLARVPIAANML